MILDEILLEIKKAKTIGIFTHESPDGDALGSSSGLKLILEKLGKKADVLVHEYPKRFEYLGIKKIEEVEIEYDLAIAVDCGVVKRLQHKVVFENAKKRIVIDHHKKTEEVDALSYVLDDIPACCEVLVKVAKHFGVEIDKEIGMCLITGIITDTGGFRHRGINSDTFEFAAKCASLGVDITKIYNLVLKTRTKQNFEMYQRASRRLKFVENGQVAVTYTNVLDIDELKPESGDFDGLVDIGLEVDGVEVSLYLKQISDSEVKVSVRAREYVNVSTVCNVFGGGGHIKASGAKIVGDLDVIEKDILAEIKKQLK